MSPFAEFPAVTFKGPDTSADLAYRHYDKDRLVLGKRMEDHLRLAVCFWHSFCARGADMFGAPTLAHPWHSATNDSKSAAARRQAGFDFIGKLGLPFYTFHDTDVMAAADDASSHRKVFAEAVEDLHHLQQSHGIRLLWGTANLFSHPRYAAGAASNPDPEIFAWAALQVRDALEATHRLGGENYVLWGGREGYDTLLNTDLRRELDQLGRFLTLVVEHKHKIGFKGTLLIEPKPHEPTKHQYDYDTAAVYGFLQRYGLAGEVKLNIEANHATLSGHSFEHEIAMAAALGVFGSIDANRGDPQNGWDTDQFPNSVDDLTVPMLEILRAGGFTTGGFNFDAKLRRQSTDLADLFHAHIGAIDVLAAALLRAAAIIEDGRLSRYRAERYAGWDTALGVDLCREDATLSSIAGLAVHGDFSPRLQSGRQEWLENLINRF